MKKKFTFFDKKNKSKKKIIKNKTKLKKSVEGFTTFEVIMIIFISVLFGIIVGCIISVSKLGIIGPNVSKEMQEVITTYNSIINEYYGEVDEKKLMNAAISGMVGILDDPHSVYMNSDDTYNFNQSVDGEYVGLGITITWVEGVCTVVEVAENSPAEKQGIKVDDVIIGVDSKDVTKSTLEEISELLTGEKGTSVSIKMKRGEEEKDFTVTRDVIEIKSVTSKVFEEDNKKIGYMYIDTFASNTYKQFSKQLKKLEKKNIDSLIIDVRGNSGGRLTQVNEILDEFLDKKIEIYRIETKGKEKKVYTTDKTKRDYPVVVLVNDGSASASEILASAFMYNYKKATIVGNTTYGKGTIQKAVELSSGASLKYTTQKWLTSKGESLQDKGLTPEVEVQQVAEYYDNPSDETDAQLKKAIEVLLEK